MSLCKRSFAQILPRQNNLEVRRQISSARNSVVESFGQSRPQSGLSFYSDATLTECLDSIDVEDYLAEQKEVIQKDDQKQFLDFPPDDIEVCVVPRKIRTVRPILPEYEDLRDQEDPFINECLNSFTCNWIVVNRRYENRFSSQERKVERHFLAKSLPKQEYEIDQSSLYSRFEDDSPLNETPNATQTPANTNTLNSNVDQAQFINGNGLTDGKNGPPLASDEDTSDGSITPPFNRDLSASSQKLQCNGDALNDETSSRASTALTNTDEVDNQWHFIDSPCHTLNNDPKVYRNSQISLTSRASRASRFFDLTNSRPDPLVSNILNTISIEEIDRLNAIRRSEARHSSLFALYPLEDESATIECRPLAMPPKEFLGHRILVRCVSLKIEFDVEPIFASLALYDVKEKKKISENFYFDLNSDQTKKLLVGHIPYQDLSTLSRTCIFNITYPTSDIFIVIKLEKVFQGDSSPEFFDLHYKDVKQKDRQKANAQLYCERLGKFRQPFAWGAICLTEIFPSQVHPFSSSTDIGSLDRRGLLDATRRRPDSSNSLNRKESLERIKFEKWRSWTPEEVSEALNNFQSATLTLSSFFKQEGEKLRDEDFYKYLNDLKKPSSVPKKLKSLAAHLKLEISPCPDEQPRYSLTPELHRLHPYPEDKVRPLKEVLEFPQREVYHPHYQYRNLLYVYPRSLNFTNRQGSARNITCKVQLMSGEEDFNALDRIFGKSGCPEFSKEAYTSISYHNKFPDFNDEIKIKLPPKLTDQHHLLFTFYHISCQKTKQSDQNPVETPIGYTWHPIYRDGRLRTGSFGLPVMIEKPPPSYSFLTPSVPIPNTKWVDNHRDIFTINIEAVSSLHSQDFHLDHFLRFSTSLEDQHVPPKYQGTNIESEFKSAILSLSKASLEPLVKFFPLVMNKLVKLLVRPPNIGGNHVLNVGQTVFEAMATILKKVSTIPEISNSSSNGRCPLLTTFVQYQCLFPHPDVTAARIINNHSNDPNITNDHHDGRYVRSNSNPNVNVEPDLVRDNNNENKAQVALERACSLRSPNHHNYQDNSASHNHKFYMPVRKLFHEELLLQWVVANGSAKECALANAWVFFDMIIKSATENLALIGGLQAPRKMRFSEQFTDDLTALFSNLINEMLNLLSQEDKDLRMIHNLNQSLAFFTRDLWSIADRGFVFTLIRHYCNHIGKSSVIVSDSITNQLLMMKIDFLRIVCNYEHFFTLNLPFNTPLFPPNDLNNAQSFFSLVSHESLLSTLTLLDKLGSFSEVSERFRKQHFLVGLALGSFNHALEINNPSIHSKAVNLIRSLLTSHDWDPRFTETEIKSRICSLYIPLLSTVVDALPQLFDWKVETTHVRPTFKRKDDKRKPIVLSSMENIDCESAIHSIDRSVAMTIASGSVTSNKMGPSFPSSNFETRRWPLKEETTKDLLMCFLWVLKNSSSSLFRRWLSELSLQRIAQLIDVLDICVSCYQYKGQQMAKVINTVTLRRSLDLKSKLEDAILGMGSARRELIQRRRDRTNSTSHVLSSQSFSQSDGIRWRKNSFQQTRYTTGSLKLNNTNKFEVENETALEGHMVYEVTMVILDTIENIILTLCQDLDSSSDYFKNIQSLVGNILLVIIHILSVNQSTKALENVFSSQRAILMKFPNLLFEERLDRELLSELSLQLLRHCSSSIGSIRAQASASLYLLMRQNYSIPSNFARIKMQVTMSLSSLVGTNQKFSEHYLRRSLKTILTYAIYDQEMQSSNFSEQVQELVFNLHMILSDTIRMKEYQEDPEMLIDLMFRIAKGYQHSPDLRLTWLANMAQKHLEKEHHAEAAQCYIHSAAMVAEYLYVAGKKPYLPMSCVAFQRISANILEESNVSSEVPADKEGLYTGKSFTENGLIALLEKAAESLSTAEMWEAVNEVYKLLIPILEAHKDFKKLASIYGKLQAIFTKLQLIDNKRSLGTFFRVGFYGAKFGDLDGEEFVYKEPSLTKLPEIANRLESFYSEQFGLEFVEVIKDSNNVDVSRFDPEKAYLQITYLEPYFDPWELDQRSLLSDKNYNIRRFIYNTPFTPDGRAHGGLHEQYKRKTILTTLNSFPYLKTRIQVKERHQIVLSPIEVAIEDIVSKTNELASIIYQDSIDPKILQMVLQGCMGTTVNQGPLEVANVFLSENAKKLPQPPPLHLQNNLRSCFKDFCQKCGDALRKNRSLIGSDQKEYQREMERNYNRFTEKLAPMISTNSQSALRTLRETNWTSGSDIKNKPVSGI